MDQRSYFSGAVWVGAAPVDGKTPAFSVLRGHFEAKKGEKARLFILGLGFFRCRINGTLINPDSFLPLSTDYEPRPEPSGEILSGHRTIVPEFDISPYLLDGDNVIAVYYGGGWYTFEHSLYGEPKVIYRILLGEGSDSREAVSSTADRIAPAAIDGYYFTRFESVDLTRWETSPLVRDFDDSALPFAVEKKPLDTEYLSDPCPADAVREETVPVRLRLDGDLSVWDAKKNLSGRPVLRLKGAPGEKIEVIFSEELDENGLPDAKYSHKQSYTVICDGVTERIFPLFTWFGFRYFSVKGPAFPEKVQTICADVRVTSDFRCGSEDINWFFSAFVHTQLCNMHTGIPSDCPHIERRGYTGDGQLVCRAAMDVLDAKDFYRKWIEDIADCQDRLSGHVQYTAPYIRSGGGPGGWGCAIVEVPYQYWLQYGDPEPFIRRYPAMLRYFDYLEAHSEAGFVTSDRAGEWCLGDWCTPQKMILPPGFVNNYFYVRSLMRILDFSRRAGFSCDREDLERRVNERKSVMTAAYFDPRDGDFLGGHQGASAFAVDIGLGDERTYQRLRERYSALEELDTGIFGTEILIRTLVSRGDGDIAVKLMTGGRRSFGGFRRAGATSLWEYWIDSLRERSHSHPMFGAAAATLFDLILGIGQPETCAGFRELEIAPHPSRSLGFAEGSRLLPCGRTSVRWAYIDAGISLSVTVPDVPAALVFAGERRPLTPGENKFLFEEK